MDGDYNNVIDLAERRRQGVRRRNHQVVTVRHEHVLATAATVSVVSFALGMIVHSLISTRRPNR